MLVVTVVTNRWLDSVHPEMRCHTLWTQSGPPQTGPWCNRASLCSHWWHLWTCLSCFTLPSSLGQDTQTQRAHRSKCTAFRTLLRHSWMHARSRQPDLWYDNGKLVERTERLIGIVARVERIWKNLTRKLQVTVCTRRETIGDLWGQRHNAAAETEWWWRDFLCQFFQQEFSVKKSNFSTDFWPLWLSVGPLNSSQDVWFASETRNGPDLRRI